jgi:hypothetical protein
MVQQIPKWQRSITTLVGMLTLWCLRHIEKQPTWIVLLCIWLRRPFKTAELSANDLPCGVFGILELDGGAVDSHGVEELLNLLGHSHVVAHRAENKDSSVQSHYIHPR